MKTKAEVVQALIAGSTGQPAGKYVTVLAEDVLIALSPEHTPEVSPEQPATESDDQPA